MIKQDKKPKLPSQIKDVPSLTKNPLVDVFLTYQFIKRIIVPFEQWDAFKLGIIDKNGKVLKKKSTLKTNQEKAAWGYFDILTANLKKLLRPHFRLIHRQHLPFILREHRRKFQYTFADATLWQKI